jgi:hypothetical protein
MPKWRSCRRGGSRAIKEPAPTAETPRAGPHPIQRLRGRPTTDIGSSSRARSWLRSSEGDTAQKWTPSSGRAGRWQTSARRRPHSPTTRWRPNWSSPSPTPNPIGRSATRSCAGSPRMSRPIAPRSSDAVTRSRSGFAGFATSTSLATSPSRSTSRGARPSRKSSPRFGRSPARTSSEPDAYSTTLASSGGSKKTGRQARASSPDLRTRLARRRPDRRRPPEGRIRTVLPRASAQTAEKAVFKGRERRDSNPRPPA